MTKAKEPQVYSYYSFKGGVGRTMTLMNLAYGLAMQGRHVLIVDMDLEAPGLSGFMTRHDPPEIKKQPRHDVIDLLIWAKDLVGDLPEGSLLPHMGPYDWPVSSDYMARVPAEKLGKNDDTFLEPGRLDVVAIDESREYYERMARLDIPNFTRQMLINVGSLLRLWFKSRRVTVEFPDYYGPMPDDERYVPYDYVFVDSRTGITAQALNCRSCEHFKLKSLPAAIADARAAIEIGNDSSACFANLGIACLADGQTEEAMAAYRSALERATVEDVKALSSELNGAIARLGELSGADEVQRMIEARWIELAVPSATVTAANA